MALACLLMRPRRPRRQVADAWGTAGVGRLTDRRPMRGSRRRT